MYSFFFLRRRTINLISADQKHAVRRAVRGVYSDLNYHVPERLKRPPNVSISVNPRSSSASFSLVRYPHTKQKLACVNIYRCLKVNSVLRQCRHPVWYVHTLSFLQHYPHFADIPLVMGCRQKSATASCCTLQEVSASRVSS